MVLSDITLVLGVDRQHLEELRWTWPTWMIFKPELREMPLLVFYDADEVDISRVTFLQDHPNWRATPWTWNGGNNQREKMITGWIHIPAKEVKTQWYLKLDTDAIATGYGQWIQEKWFEANSFGERPVFISSTWSYSKPRYVMDLLDDWADRIPELALYPRLNLAYSSEDRRLVHPRIISWLFFGRTDWTQSLFRYLGAYGKLPHPSQDTVAFYCAKRQRKYFVRERMQNFNWEHRRIWKIRNLLESLGVEPAPVN